MSPSGSPEAEDGREYEAWEETLRTIAATGGPALIVGGVDVGKTTFARLLVNRIAAGRRVAVLDADPGQSEIGPPGCAGLAFVSQPIRGLSDLTPSALAFVGAVSPAAHSPEHIIAIARLAALAEDAQLIVDTSGYIHGAGARRLIQCEAQLLSPSHVVGLQRGDELRGILAPLRRRTGCLVHTPAIPAAIGAKPPALRAQRRAMRFAAYFHEAQPVSFALAGVALTGTWLGGGTPLPAHILRFINVTLGAPNRVYYGETAGRHLGLMANRPISPTSPEMGIVLEQLKTRELTVTSAPRLQHLLVGLEASNGKLLGLGLIASLDFRRGTIGLLTPVRSADAACVLKLGTQRVAPDGADCGQLKPGEM